MHVQIIILLKMSVSQDSLDSTYYVDLSELFQLN